MHESAKNLFASFGNTCEMQAWWLRIHGLLLALASAKQLKLCLILPFNDAYKQVQLGALQAVDDITNGDIDLVGRFKMYSTEFNITSAIYGLDVVLEVVEQTSVLGTYDSASVCMNNGGHAVIGPAYSSRSKIVSQYLSRNLHKPLISFSATSPALSDSATYPYFSRTVTPDDSVAFAAIDFVQKSGWSKVAFLYSDDLFGQGLHNACRDYAKDNAAKFGPEGLGWISVPIPPDPRLQSEVAQIETAIATIRDSDSLVVFFGGVSAVLPIVIEKALKLGIIGNTSGYTWLGFDTWGRHSVTGASIKAMSGSIRLMASGCPGGPADNAVIKKLQASNPAALSMKYGGQEMPTAYAEMGSIDCRAGFSYDAVWLAALSFSTINSTETISNHSSCAADAAAAEDNALVQGSQLWQALLQTSFTGGSGAVWLASNGDRDSASIRISIENLRDSDVTTYVGDLVEGVPTLIDFTNIIWADGTNELPLDHSGGCPSGSVNNETVRECYACAAGRFAEVAATSCAVCPDGKYNQRTGSSECDECSMIQAIAEQCQTCRAGQYRLSKECFDCDRNTFSDNTDLGSCEECPLGKYQPDKGKGYCIEVRSGSTLVQSRSTGGSDEVAFEELRCPAVGVDCDSGHPKYTGSVWHDTSVAIPNCTADDPPVCTLMYVCVTEGCPDADATEMKCKEGYVADSPLCALCEKGYFYQQRKCVECREPKWTQIALAILGLIVILSIVFYAALKHRRFLSGTGMFTYLKILISFMTVSATIDKQVSFCFHAFHGACVMRLPADCLLLRAV
jgi:ABC-type branched-subunit amino acid transport system substrate-binding protein